MADEDGFPSRELPERLYRISFTDDPLALRPRGLDRALGRFDDPFGEFRVLYTSGSRLGAYLEKLSDFQLDLATLAAVHRIRQDVAEKVVDLREYAYPDADRFRERYVAEIEAAGGRFAEIASAVGLETLRSRLAGVFAGEVSSIDVGTLLGADYELTQLIARSVFEDRAGYSGIAIPSTMGVDHENFIVFEKLPEDRIVRPEVHLAVARVQTVDRDPDLTQALNLLQRSTPGLRELLGRDVRVDEEFGNAGGRAGDRSTPAQSRRRERDLDRDIEL